MSKLKIGDIIVVKNDFQFGYCFHKNQKFKIIGNGWKIKAIDLTMNHYPTFSDFPNDIILERFNCVRIERELKIKKLNE